MWTSSSSAGSAPSCRERRSIPSIWTWSTPAIPRISTVCWSDLALAAFSETEFVERRHLPDCRTNVDRFSRNSYNLGMKAIVSEKGQVTIPKPLRERLGLRPGQVLDFREERGRLVAVKQTSQDPVESVYGILKFDRSTGSLLKALRGTPDAV